jgi:brefeldin A-inhibited guanine nucleotide-exchange protein
MRKVPNEELANESRSTHITVATDMVFSLSHYLNGVGLKSLNYFEVANTRWQTAIVDFVRALCDISWEEIQSSGLSQHPRLFSLQKLVEISYYNMSRIRLEWSNLWDILGEHFNQVGPRRHLFSIFLILDRFVVTTILMSVSLRLIHSVNWPCASWKKKSCLILDSRRTF